MEFVFVKPILKYQRGLAPALALAINSLFLVACDNQILRFIGSSEDGSSHQSEPGDTPPNNENPTMPTLTGVLNDGIRSLSTSKSPILSWSSLSFDSSLYHYEVCIGTGRGLGNVVDWTATGISTSYQISGLSLSDGTTYFASLRLVSTEGRTSTPLEGDGWIVSSTISGLNLNDGTSSSSLVNSPTITWDISSIVSSGWGSYEIAIGSQPGREDLMEWTSVAATISYASSSLNLNPGATYFAALRVSD